MIGVAPQPPASPSAFGARSAGGCYAVVFVLFLPVPGKVEPPLASAPRERSASERRRRTRETLLGLIGYFVWTK